MATTTIETDTELSAVNSILGAIGQAPITQLKDPTTGAITNANPEIQFIYNLLRDANVDTQSEGWHFNRERHVTFNKDLFFCQAEQQEQKKALVCVSSVKFIIEL